MNLALINVKIFKTIQNTKYNMNVQDLIKGEVFELSKTFRLFQP